LGDRVAGEADLVAVIAEPAPAMEQQGPLALALLVGKVDIVKPPRRTHSRHLGVGFLLPVEPPEIDSLLLQRMEDQVHVVGGEFLVGEVEGDVLPAGGIDAHGPGHLGVVLLPWLNTRCRVQVQAGLQMVGVQPGQELARIGKEQRVPGVAAPAEAVTRLVLLAARLKLFIAEMPIHVDDENIERYVVLVEAADDLFDFLVGVGPVARPPGAKSEPGRQRDAARDPHIITERLAVVMTVAEEVPVLAVTRGAFHDPGPGALLAVFEAEVGRIEERTRGVVDHGPAGAGNEAWFNRLPGLVAERAVQGTRSSLEVLVIGLARMPDDRLAVNGEFDGEVFGRKPAVLRRRVGERQCARLDR